MSFRELNHAKCKTYLARCESHRLAALIDPVRDHLDRYIAMLAYFGCRLEMIVDTHTHRGPSERRASASGALKALADAAGFMENAWRG